MRRFACIAALLSVQLTWRYHYVLALPNGQLRKVSLHKNSPALIRTPKVAPSVLFDEKHQLGECPSEFRKWLGVKAEDAHVVVCQYPCKVIYGTDAWSPNAMETFWRLLRLGFRDQTHRCWHGLGFMSSIVSA